MSQPLLEPGFIIAARYRVNNAIGRGGYAVVYESTRLEDGASVALKLLHIRHLTSPVKIKRFEREAALAKQLHHTNVVETLDFGHTDAGLPFIVFELLRGQSLSERLKIEGALSFTRTCQISIQVLRALTAAHALDIAHRDIKPGNIFLCAGRDDDFVKVLDFGIAKALRGPKPKLDASQLTRVGQLLGTPTYMSPEQIKGRNVGLNTDLYSLGLVMTELLTGRKAIRAANEQAVFVAHLSVDEHELSETVLESPLGEIIRKAIRKAPAERFATAEEMLARVEAVAVADRFGAPRASTVPPVGNEKQSIAPTSLALLKETVRASEPPPASLALLKETVRTPESLASLPAHLASLQETMRLDPEVSVDDYLRQVTEQIPAIDETESEGGAVVAPTPAQPTSPMRATPAAIAPRHRLATPVRRQAARAASTNGVWLVALLIALALLGAGLAYWLVP